MNWTDLRDGLEKILPFVADALPGAGPAIGTVLSAAFNTSNTPEAVQAALTADPQAADKIMAFKLQLQTIVSNQAVADHQAGVALQQSDAADRASARALAMAKGFLPQIVISVLFISGYFVIFDLMITGNMHVPPEFHDTYEQALGALLTIVMMVATFWLGSTHSSQKKDAAIVDAAVSP